MAEKETKEETKKEPGDDKKEKKSGSILGWIIMGLVVVIFAGGGYGLSMVLAKSKTPEVDETAKVEDPAEKINKLLNASATDAKTWTYELDYVVANLDEPGVTRYIRTTAILEIAPEMNQELGTVFLDEKALYLRDWMTEYLAGLTIEEVRGSRSQAKIKTHMREKFNEMLFPDNEALINRVLLKEFAIQ